MRKKSDQLASSPDLILPVDKIGGGVQFTDRLEKPSHRRKRLNQYLRGDRIGKGRHGEVYLCYDTLHDNREVVCPYTLPYLQVVVLKARRLAGCQARQTKQSQGQDKAAEEDLSAGQWLWEVRDHQYREQRAEGNRCHEGVQASKPRCVARGY